MTTPSIYRTTEGERAVMALYDGVLAHWPLPHEELYVDTRHGRTFVIAGGEPTAPPLLLIHGASSNAVSWIGDVAAFSRHHRVYAVDTIGDPGRSAQNRPPWAGPAYAEWLEDVLGALHAPQASLLGISQGGWVALKFATTHPERVRKLVLLAPAGVAQARPSFLLRAMLFSLLGRRGAQATNRIVFGDAPIAQEAVSFMDAVMTHVRPRFQNMPLFSDDELRRLAMPVLLVAGARDALLPTEKTAARLQQLLPHLQSLILPEAGHVLHSLAPEILPFLTAP